MWISPRKEKEKKTDCFQISAVANNTSKISACAWANREDHMGCQNILHKSSAWRQSTWEEARDRHKKCSHLREDLMATVEHNTQFVLLRTWADTQQWIPPCALGDLEKRRFTSKINRDIKRGHKWLWKDRSAPLFLSPSSQCSITMF